MNNIHCKKNFKKKTVQARGVWSLKCNKGCVTLWPCHLH
jgi:hypothetical protein